MPICAYACYSYLCFVLLLSVLLLSFVISVTFVFGKMTSFTNEEYADILMAYGRANSNAREARRVYQERYPNRRVPSHQTFTNTYRRLRETGNLWFQEPRVSIREGNVNIDERILAEFEADPTKSVRMVAAALGLGIWKVWSVLRHDGRHPFHYTPVQGMYVLLGTLDFFF